MTIDKVVDEVAEGHARHKIEHTSAERNDRCFGESEILKTIVREVYESDARNHCGNYARHHSDGAIVNLPRLQTLFDEESAESRQKTMPMAGQSPLNKRQKAALAAAAKRSTIQLLKRGIFFISCNCAFASSSEISSVNTWSESRLKRVMVSKLMPACANGEMQV